MGQRALCMSLLSARISRSFRLESLRAQPRLEGPWAPPRPQHHRMELAHPLKANPPFLYETLEAAWPRHFISDGLAYTLRWKIRNTLRRVSYRVVFTEEEAWQETIKNYAIAAMDRLHWAYFGHPWFWAMAWPAVFAAAAVELFPGIGTFAELRWTAAEAAQTHFAALLVHTAAHDSTAVYGLPGPAVMAMQLLHEPLLPTLPCFIVHEVVYVAEVNPRDWQSPPPRLELPPGACRLLEPLPGSWQALTCQIPGTWTQPWATWERRQQRRATSSST